MKEEEKKKEINNLIVSVEKMARYVTSGVLTLIFLHSFSPEFLGLKGVLSMGWQKFLLISGAFGLVIFVINIL